MNPRRNAERSEYPATLSEGRKAHLPVGIVSKYIADQHKSRASPEIVPCMVGQQMCCNFIRPLLLAVGAMAGKPYLSSADPIPLQYQYWRYLAQAGLAMLRASFSFSLSIRDSSKGNQRTGEEFTRIRVSITGHRHCSRRRHIIRHAIESYSATTYSTVRYFFIASPCARPFAVELDLRRRVRNFSHSR